MEDLRRRKSLNKFTKIITVVVRRENVNNDACPGHPNTSTIDKSVEVVKKIVMENCRLREVAEDVAISVDSYLVNLSDILGMKYIRSKLLKYSFMRC